MKSILKILFKDSFIEVLLLRVFKYLYIKSHDKTFNPYLISNDHHQKLQIDRIISRIKLLGAGINFNGYVMITNPEMVSIGKNVHIGDNAYFNTIGGLIIGDNTHISRNVTIYTQNHNYQGDALPYDSTKILKPVSIGKNVWIGMNVSIVPGVSIGDGAIVGMGTVVTKDVPDNAIVGNTPFNILKERDKIHYVKLEELNRFGGVDGRELDASFKETSGVNALSKGKDIIFVVSTGRSGSQSISKILSKHQKVLSLHEPHGQLIRLSTEYAHGVKSREEVKKELTAIFNKASVFPKEKIYIESDQKLSNLIEILNELLPECRFIWLVRKADQFVSSAFSRRWFSDDEIKYAKSEFHAHWINYRLNGFRCGVFTEEEWKNMVPFARNCWYWTYWNDLIEAQLSKIDRQRFFVIKLEEFEEGFDKLLNFLGIEKRDLENKIYNQSEYIKLLRNEWDKEMAGEYEKWCGKKMKSFYNS